MTEKESRSSDTWIYRKDTRIGEEWDPQNPQNPMSSNRIFSGCCSFFIPPLIYYCNVLLSGKQTVHQYYGKRRGLSVIITDSETDIPERKYTGF